MVGSGCLLYLIVFLKQQTFVFGNLSTNTKWMRSTTISNNSNVLPGIHELCPYSRHCHSSPLKNVTDSDLESCCERCYCDPKCYEIGNCCPDVNLSPSKSLRYPCIDISTSSTYSLFYHVVDDCKDEPTAKLYPECFQPKELSDLVVVSDPSTGRVYKNKHCAKCHDVTNYVTWKLHVGCSDFLNKTFQTVDERDRFLYEDRQRCSVHSVPSDDDDIRHISRCFSTSVVEICNYTAKWDYYDEKIEKACLENKAEQNIIFVDINSYRRMKFSNAYCYMCNSPRNAVKQDLCEKGVLDDDIRKSNVLPLFTALLDHLPANNDGDIGEHCKKHEIWDPYTEYCREIRCPGGTIPINGRCQSALTYSERHMFKLYFNVDLDDPVATFDDTTLMHILAKKVNSMYPSECRDGRRALYTSDISSKLVLCLHMGLLNNCTANSLLETTRKLATNGLMKLSLRNQTRELFKVKMQINLERNSIDDLQYRSGKEWVTKHGFLQTLDRSILLYCPSIFLTRSEVLYFGFDNSSNILILNNGQKLYRDIQTNAICVNDYFEARNALSAAPPTSSVYTYLSLCALLIHIYEFLQV